MLIGFLVGIVIGLVIGPILRSWLTWQEYRHAEREARLADDVLRLMDRSVDDRGADSRNARSS